MNRTIQKQYLSLATGSWAYPTFGINDIELKKFTEDMIRNGTIDCGDTEDDEIEDMVRDALSDHPVEILLAFLLEKGYLSTENFKKLVQGSSFSTGVVNYEEAYPDLIQIGVRINEEE